MINNQRRIDLTRYINEIYYYNNQENHIYNYTKQITKVNNATENEDKAADNDHNTIRTENNVEYNDFNINLL